MPEAEVSFRAALHEEKFSAAALLFQLEEAFYEQKGYLTSVQILRLAVSCQQLLVQRP